MPTPRTSSSAVETEITGSVLASRPASLNCLQKATLVSPLIVWKTASGLAFLILLIVVAYSVLPSGAYSSPTIVEAVGLRPGLDLLVGRAREDVVRADEEELLDLELLLEELQAGDDLLVGRRAGVEDVRRRLEALVLDGVVEQRLVALEDGQHRLAARRGPAAERGGDLVGRDELLRLLGERRPVRCAVLDDGLELLAEHAALGVDLLDREQLGVAHRHLADRHRAAQRVQDADGDRVPTGASCRSARLTLVAATAGDDDGRRDCDDGKAPASGPRAEVGTNHGTPST